MVSRLIFIALCILSYMVSVASLTAQANVVQASERAQITDVVIIDDSVPDAFLFEQSLAKGAKVHRIGRADNGIASLLNTLAQYQSLDSLHIISHADENAIYLGKDKAKVADLTAQIQALQQRAKILKPGADILFYGCNLAKQPEQQRLLNQFHQSSGLDIAASTNLTGNAKLGGDWAFEYQQGVVDAKIPFDERLLADYRYVLVTVTFAGLGASDSGGTGYKSLTDVNLVVDNLFSGFNPDIAYNNTADASKTLVIKADGVDAESFDVSAITLYAFNANGLSIASSSTIVFKDKNGTTLQTMTLNANKSMAQNVDTDMFSMFDNNTTSPVTGVAQIDFNFAFNNHGVNGNDFSNLTFKNITYTNVTAPSAAPTISGVTYDSSTGNLVVTGTNFDANTGLANDVTVNKFTITGEGGGGSAYTLTSATNIERDSATQFTIPISGSDKLRLDALLNKNSTSADDGTAYNLAAADDFIAAITTGNTAIATNAITVSNYANPAITSATYNASTGALVVTGTGFSSISGANNDVVANTFTLTGDSGATYTLTDTSNVDVSSATTFTLSLSATDKYHVNGLLNKNGLNAASGQAYNLAAADNWMAGGAANVNIADSAATITTSNVTAPAVTSATYNQGTGVLAVTGSNFVAKVGATNDVDVTKLTLTGEGGNTYTLTSSNVEITSATSFSVTLNSADKLNINGLLNKDGTQADDGATNYNLNAADRYLPATDSASSIADTTNAITVSNTQVPTITSATYNGSTGVLVVTGTGFAKKTGAANDIDASKLSLAGEGGNSYTLTSTSVEVSSLTSFTLVLNATDKINVNGLLNKDGTTSGDNTTYNLAGAEDWQAGAGTSATIADLTSNGVTVSNTQVPTVTSATYDYSTGVLAVTGTNLIKKSGVTNDIDLTKITLKGLASGTRTLTTSNVEITSATAFSVTLNSADKTAVNALLDANGTQSSDAVTYNLSAAEDWAAGAAASATVADTSGNGITVSNVPQPSITSATYNFSTGALVVTGSDFSATVGLANDVVVNKLTLTGEGGSSYTMTSATNVEIDNATQFTVTLAGADKLAVNGLLNKNGTTADSGTTYNLAVADDFIANVTAGNTADTTGNGVTVSSVSAPTVSSATYDFATGVLAVTGTNFTSVSGAANDVDTSKLTLTGDAGGTYTLTTSAVEVSSETAFSVTLNATDKLNVGGLLNKDGLTSGSGTTYNLAAADNFIAGAAPNSNIADTTGNGVTVSNVAAPTVTSATYDFATGVLTVTGTNFVKEFGANNDIDVIKLTLTGDSSGSYTLTSTSVEITDATTFSVTLNTADKLNIGGLLNKNGVASGSGTTYNLAAADNYLAGADAAVDIADATGNGVTVSNVALPTITSATYNAATGVFAVTGTNLVKEVGATNDVLVSKMTVTGEGSGTRTLTSSNVEITDATSFSVTLNSADKLVVNGLLNKDGTTSGDNTTYNLAVATLWLQGSDATANSADATNAITVSNTAVPTVTSATYDAASGVLAVTATGLVSKSGATNDVDVTKLTLTGQAGGTRTLTSGNVEITNETSFSVTLNSADKLAVNGLLNKNGITSSDATSYNLAAAEDWLAGAAASANIADTTGNGVTVSNVANPTITSASYDVSTGILAVTGSDFVANAGATNDVDVSKLTLTGDGGASYTLTGSSVEITSATSFSVTLNAADKLQVGGLLNKNGTTSDSGTTYNLAAADNWMPAADSAANIADTTGNGVTVSNVANPTITSATYNAGTGQLVLTGTNFVAEAGGNNDIVTSALSLTGQGNASYTLTSSAVEVSSATAATITLNASDKVNINGLLNKNGTLAGDGSTYNLAAADNWLAGAAASVDIADSTGNGITVSGVVTPTITSATYNAATGVLVVTGTSFAVLSGSNNDVDVTKLTLTGEGSGTYTLTGSGVDITSETSFSVTLSAADKLSLNSLLNKNGTQSDDNTTYNLGAADNWLAAAPSATNIADLTGNAVTVSAVATPALTAATYNATTGVFGFTATSLIAKSGSNNDIDPTKLTVTGDGGNTYVLTGSQLDISSETSFSITLSATDKINVNGLLNLNGTLNDSNTAYNIAAADNWLTGAAASSNIADATTPITVSGVVVPTITSVTFDATTADLVVNGTGFVKTAGADVNAANLFTFTGQGGNTATLSIMTAEITSETQFTLNVHLVDRHKIYGLLNKNGTLAEDGTTYNINFLDGWMPGVAAGVNESSATNAITVSNVITPSNTASTYNATTGNFSIAGLGYAQLAGANNDVDVTKFTVTGQNGATYTLTTSNIEVTDSKTISLTVNEADRIALNGLLNKAGSSAESGTTYNLAAADNFIPAALSTADISDTTTSISVSNITTPTITSATYNFASGALAVTGTNFRRQSGANNDIDVTKLSLKGEAGNSYTLTSSNVEITSETAFSVTLSETDKINVNGLLNKDGTGAEDTTVYNLAAADNWMPAVLSTADITDATNGVTVSGVVTPSITSITYDYATGTITVTGTNFVKKFGSANDVDVSLLTFTGENGQTYTITSAVDIEITSSTSFTIVLSGADLAGINALISANGTTAASGTSYNIAAADNWMTGTAASTNIADGTTGVTTSNAPVPTITSATYDFASGALVVTGADFKAKIGALNDVSVSKLTLTGEGGTSYTLTSGDVEITSVTEFSVTLNASDKLAIGGLLNKNGTLSDSGTTYNLSAADDFIAQVTTGDTSDSTASVTVSNVAAPTITAATYDVATGSLVVSGSNFSAKSGATNDIDISMLSFTGEASGSYTITSASDVEVTSSSSFTVTLSGTDLLNVNGLLNKNGTSADDATSYNLAAADNWATGASPSTDIADSSNGITVSNVVAPAVTSATYDATTGVIVVTGTGFSSKLGGSNDVDISLITFTGENGATYTLTSATDIEVTSTTSFTLTLSGSDKTQVDGLLNKNGGASDSSGSSFNIALADNWLTSAAPSVDIADAGSPVTVSNVTVPTVSSSTYDASTGLLSVTGTNFRNFPGSNNDVDLTKFTVKGHGGATYTLTTTGVEITNSTTFSATLNSADQTGVEPLFTKASNAALDNTFYNLAAADNWMLGAAPSTDITDTSANIFVSNLQPAKVTLKASTTTIAEAAGSTTLTAAISRVVDTNVSVSVGLSYSGSATSVADYTAPSSIVISGGSTSASATLTAVADSAIETNETVIVDIASVTGPNAQEDGVQQQTITITDDDSALVTLSASSNSMAETGGSVTLTATLDKASYEAVTVSLGYSGTASNGTDYGTPAGTITISAGQTTGTTTLNATSDANIEQSETIIVDITAVSDGKASESGTQQQTVTITDDDTATVTLAVNNSTMSETGGSSTVTATLDKVTYETVTVSLGYGGTATSGTDYATPASSITIAAGQTSGTATLTATADSSVEADETIIVDITAVSGGKASESGTQQPTVTITDDDTTTVTLAVNNSTMSETGGSSTVTATLDKATYETVTVSLGYSGTATSGTDYATPASSITIAAGQTSGTATLTATADGSVEADETIIVDITAVSGGKASESGTQQQTVTITDDDTALVSLAVNNSTMSETGGSSTVTATLDKATYETVTVSLGYGGTATSGTDYATPASSITIAAGQTSGTATLTATTDGSVEADETIIVDITAVSGGKASESGTQQQTVTITDDDTALVSLAVNNSTMSETGGSSTVTATLDKATYETVTVSLGYGGTATSGTDYATPASSITIAAGQTSGTATLTATADSSVEADETIIVDITAVSGGKASESGTQQQAVTITDDDTTTATLAVNNSTMSETGGSSTVTATLDKATYETVTVSLGYGGMAISGTDYATPASSITIAAGQTSGTATLTATADSSVEADETIIVDITAVSGGKASESGSQQQTVTITDDDTTSVTLDIAQNSINENGGTTSISASLSSPTYEAVTVGLSYGGSATSGSDYSAPATIIIAAGQTSGAVTLTVIDDPTEEPDETVSVEIVSVSGGSASESGSQIDTVVIANDDDQTAPSGYAVTIDAVNINAANQTAMSFTFSNAEIGASYSYTLSDSQGVAQAKGDETLPDVQSAVATGSGTVTSANQTVSNISAVNLADGLITLSVTLSDSAGNVGATASASVNKDTLLPTATLSPANGEIDVAAQPSLVMSFSEAISAGSSNNQIELKQANDDSVVFSVSADDASVNISGSTVTLALSERLSGATAYYVNVGSGAFADAAGNNFAGLSGSSAWRFTVLSTTPVSVADSGSVDEDNSVAIDVLDNDSGIDANLNPASVTVVTAPQNGSTSINTANGLITYTPNANFNGEDRFVYTVSDLNGATSNETVVTVSVKAINDAPVAVDDVISLAEDETVTIDVLVNDSDVDGQGQLNSASLQIVEAPSHGQASIVDGKVQFVAQSNYFGSDSFTYKVADSGGLVSNSAKVSLNISSTNDAPVTQQDSATTDEEVAVTIDVLGNDSDIDGQLVASSVAIIAQASHGEAVAQSDGTIVYTPVKDYVGSDSFSYTVSDDLQAVSSPAEVTVTITNINDAPTVADDTAIVQEDVAFTINVTGNDSDIDGSISAVTISSSPANGQVSIDPANALNIIYTPGSNFSGSDSFAYQAVDDTGASSVVATVRLTIEAVNDAPIANNDSVQVNEESSIDIDVLGNDSDVDGQLNPQSVAVVSSASGGITEVLANGQIRYTGSPNFIGEDSFVYQVSDLEGASATATVSVVVINANDGPSAGDMSLSTEEDTALAIVLAGSDPDGDSLSYLIKSQPQNGVLSGSGANLSYQPNRNFFGSDSFTYTVSDGVIESSLATVTIAVSAQNDAPVADSQTIQVLEDGSVNIRLSGSDVENSALSFELSSSPAHGQLSGSAPDLVYTPAANFFGNDGFSFKVSDGTAQSQEATVSITVQSVNDLPVASAFSLSLKEDKSVSFSLNGSDIDGDGLTFSIVSGPANGQLNGQSPQLIYTPNGDFNGADSFSYQANDGFGSSAPVTVTIVVAPVNDAPVAFDDSITRDNWLAFDINPLANDIDVDGDSLRIIGAKVNSGTLNFDTNLIRYAPIEGFVGAEVIEYRISDGQGGIAAAKVVVNIEVSQNDLPVITPPPDVEVNATALSTKVDLGVATAVDRLGNPLQVSLDGVSTFFKPGLHTVFWTATDSDGRSSVASQLVKVNPLISVDKAQTVLEGYAVTIGIRLNGSAPSYPLSVPYTIGGTAEAGVDHDLQEGTLIIESGTSGFITFNVFADNVFEGDETVTLSLASSVNRGARSIHTVTISERNVNPKVNLVATQAQQERFVINREDGLVVVSAEIDHPNGDNLYHYSWSNKQGVLQDIDSDDATFTFDPSSIETGVYHITLEVVDADDTDYKGRKQITMKLEQSATVLGGQDSDNDGIADDVEGLKDDDNDGIPDYQDSIAECNVLPETAASEASYLVEGDPGVCMRLGDVALGGQSGGTRIGSGELSIDEDASNVGGVFDFIAYGLPVAGQSYSVVLPQTLPIPSNALYRKQNAQGLWRDFVQSASEQLWSSAGEAGFCPPPGDDSWVPGLVEGYWCVQLVITDGGPNDADGTANGTIVDPGGVAVMQSSNQTPLLVNDEVQTRSNSPMLIDVLANDSDADGDSLMISSANAIFGSVDVQNDQLYYQPALDYFGIDTVVYGVSDGQGGTASATLTVTVLPNANPVAGQDSATVIAGQNININVLANDSDIEGDSLSVIAAGAQHGTVTIESDNSLTYYANEDFTGIDTIEYRIEDALGAQAIGKVSVTVEPNTSAVNIQTKGGGGLFYLLLVYLCILGFCRWKNYPTSYKRNIALSTKDNWG